MSADIINILKDFTGTKSDKQLYKVVWRTRCTKSCLTLCNPMDHTCQVPLCMEFSRQECWNRLPFLLPGDVSNPGIELLSLASTASAGRFFTTEPPGKPIVSAIHQGESAICIYPLPLVPLPHPSVPTHLGQHRTTN